MNKLAIIIAALVASITVSGSQLSKEDLRAQIKDLGQAAHSAYKNARNIVDRRKAHADWQKYLQAYNELKYARNQRQVVAVQTRLQVAGMLNDEIGNSHGDDRGVSKRPPNVLAGAVYFEGSWYKLMKTKSKRGWVDAHSMALAHRGKLVEITSRSEYNFVKNLRSKDDETWIGTETCVDGYRGVTCRKVYDASAYMDKGNVTGGKCYFRVDGTIRATANYRAKSGTHFRTSNSIGTQFYIIEWRKKNEDIEGDSANAVRDDS